MTSGWEKVGLRRIRRLMVYAKRGHSLVAILVSLANSIIIQYGLLVEKVPALKQLFPTILHYAATVAPLYLALVCILGWIDYRRLMVPVEQSLVAINSPWHRSITEALYRLATGENQKAAELLKPWVEQSSRTGKARA